LKTIGQGMRTCPGVRNEVSGTGDTSNAGPPSRWELMLGRVERTARTLGVDRSGRELIRTAIEAAMATRLVVIDNDHDPDYLHPSRTVVVLLDDVGLADPVALAAASLLETRRDDLVVPDGEISEHVSPAVAAFRNAVPRSSSGTLLEDLLASEREVVLVALAERIDQVRHAHLWGDPAEARAAHEEASEIYLKIAERTHARLATRYTSWCRSFGEGYLIGAQDTDADT
jgi:(p)ppGpp synthase/HD superfamily hydrolase